MKKLMTSLFAVFFMVALSVASMPRISHLSHGHVGAQVTLVSQAFADESPAPVVSPSPAPESAIGKVGKFLEDLAGKIPVEGVVITVLAFIYDLVRRKFPTKNPASLIGDVQKILRGLGMLLTKLDKFLDSVVGQNLK